MFKVTDGTPWILVCTDKFDETVARFRDVMDIPIFADGKPTVDTQFNRYAQFKLPGGAVIEVLEPVEHLRGLYKGTIYSVTVDNVASARTAMEATGTKFISPIFDDKKGFGWTYFQLPAGEIMQIQGSV